MSLQDDYISEFLFKARELEENIIEFNSEDYLTFADDIFDESKNVIVDPKELLIDSSRMPVLEESKTVEGVTDHQIQQDYLFQDGVNDESDRSFEEEILEYLNDYSDDLQNTFEEELNLQIDIAKTNQKRKLDSESKKTSPLSDAGGLDATLERSSKFHRKEAINNAFIIHRPPGGKVVRGSIDSEPSKAKGSNHLLGPLLNAGPEKESTISGGVLFGNASLYSTNQEDPAIFTSTVLSSTDLNGKRRVSEPILVSSKRRKFEVAAPSSISAAPSPKRKVQFEEPLLQNLPGLSSIRVANNWDEFRFFDKFALHEDVTSGLYIYEIGPRARTNCYEPLVIRKKLNDPDAGFAGLCPYCPTMKFLLMNTSAYLHHMTVQHGVFSNGTMVEEPGTCVEEVLTNCGKKEKTEFFICPYNCELKQIRMKKINEHNRFGNRYKVYLRHVKDCHGCGKRDNQLKKKEA